MSECRHDHAAPVESDGAILAYLCPDCDTQLPADFGKELERRREIAGLQASCAHEEVMELKTFDGTVITVRCQACGATVQPEQEPAR